ncbi:MAG TPA: O-antigen ligase family protein, partial [Flavisolibacter sp.]|nr:O-antigen ligase family protein [Flavisolibacter sp.]
AIMLLLFRRRQSTENKIHPLAVILLVQIAWLVIAVIFSSHFILSVKYLLAKSWYLLAFFVAPLLLWRDEKSLKRSALVLFSAMLLATVLTMIRHAVMNFTFSSINDALAPFFRNHVNYSALLVFMVPLQVLLLKQARTKMQRPAVILSFLITLPALYFSFARGAWLALITGAISFPLLRKRWLLQSFVLVVIFMIAAVFWLRHNNRYVAFAHDYRSTIFHENFREHLTATYELKDMSTAERFYRWVAGVRMIEDSWQAGFGPTTFYQHYKSYTVPAFKTWVSRNEEQSTVHNYFLLLIIEQGAFGLMLFVLLLGTVFWYAQKVYHRTTDLFWKRSVAVIAALMAMQCTLNFLSDLIETDKVGSVFYLCIAALIIIDKKTTTKKENLNLKNRKP